MIPLKGVKPKRTKQDTLVHPVLSACQTLPLVCACLSWKKLRRWKIKLLVCLVLVDMFSLVITKVYLVLTFFSVFKILQKEIMKTIKWCFHHFFRESFKTRNKVKTMCIIIIISKNGSNSIFI